MAANLPSQNLLNRYSQAAATVNGYGSTGGGAGGYGNAGLNLLMQYYNPQNWGTNISSQYLPQYTAAIENAYQQQLSQVNELYSRRGMLGSSEHRAALQRLDMDRGTGMAGAKFGAFQQQQQFSSDWLDKMLGYLQNQQQMGRSPGAMQGALYGAMSGKAASTLGFPGTQQAPVKYTSPSMTPNQTGTYAPWGGIIGRAGL